MPRRILLVRHGESIDNTGENYEKLPDHAVPLTKRGHEQAKAAGLFVRSFYSSILEQGETPKIRLWTSPYERSRQTADHIEAINKDIINCGTREHINLCEQQWGLLHGLDREQIKALYPETDALYEKCKAYQGKFWVRMPQGESRFDVAVRVHEAFGSFHRDDVRYGIDNVIVVCHGTTLRAFVMQYFHLTPEWFEHEPNPENGWIRYIEAYVDKGYIYKGMAC
ncbi:MAG: histidine phosphatase family protein [Acidiferrobacterales bacterium]